MALLLGKFVIVAVLSLAAGALAGGSGSTPSGSGAAATGSAGGGGFGAVLGGAALLLLSGFAPWALFRLLPFLEAGAVGHLDGLAQRSRQQVVGPAKGLAHDAMRLSEAGVFAGAAAGAAGGVLDGVLSPARGGSSRSRAGGPGAGASVAREAAGGRVRGEQVGSGLDHDRSSAPTTGVGTMESPGHGIPDWAVNPEATAAARYYLGEGFEGGVGPGAGLLDPPPAATGATTPLPRQTGLPTPDALGRDELGIRLIAAKAPALPAPPPGPSGPSGLRDPESGRGG